jgi:cell division transport system permease protein
VRTEFVLSEVTIGLRRNLTMTLASVVVVMVTLTLLGVALVIDHGTSKTKAGFYGKLHVSVFFDLPCGSKNASSSNCSTPDEEAAVRQTLSSLSAVKSINFVSQQEAYQRFKVYESDDPALVKSVGPEALPESLDVTLKDPRQFSIVNDAVSRAPGVGDVNDASGVLKKLFSFFNRITVAALVFALILLVATILLIYNAMRVAAFSRRRETGIMRLVGASNFAIQVPFILEGTVIGVAGSALAVLLLIVFREFVHSELKTPLLVQFGEWSMLGFALPIVILIGIVLPSLASFLTLQRHLRV